MAPIFRFAAVLLALTLPLGLVMGQSNCDICSAATLPLAGARCQGQTQNSNNRNSIIFGLANCNAARLAVRCGECNNPNKANERCCNGPICTQVGNQCQCKCECGPPAQNSAGSCGDPHFRGAYGVAYDFHGLPDRDFNLISDRQLAVNAHFIGQDGEETGVDGTWMGAMGLLWTQTNQVRNATFTVKQGPEVHTDAVPFIIELDGEELSGDALASYAKDNDNVAYYKDEGIALVPSEVGSALQIQIGEHLSMVLSAASHDHPTGNHIDFGIGKLYVTDTVHGALGQTFAAARGEALKAAAAIVGSTPLDASDIVEGKDIDYMTSSLLSTDFKFNRFNPQTTGFEKFNVVRKLLGVAHELAHESPVAEELKCNNVDGKVRCYL